jgi:FAD synthetase
VVIVARDANVKHKPKPVNPEEQRLKMVQALRVVDRALLGSKVDIFKPIEEINPDIITLGFDQHFDVESLQRELQSRGLKAKVVRIEARDCCDLCSSRKIVAKILGRNQP